MAAKSEMTDKESQIELRPGIHIHLVGIGGSGLSAIARVLLDRNYVVSGSDQQRNELTAELAESGATVFFGHSPENCAGAHALLISSAVPPDNPEVVAAQKAGIPVLKRAEFLRILMADSYAIAVAGTHGKTTTAGIIAQILIEAGMDPSVIVGGVLPLMGSNGRAGQGQHFIIEADEYDNMFLGLRPQLAVVTNIEYDHPDLYPTTTEYHRAFRKFARLLPAGGRLVICSDDPGASALGRDVDIQTVTIENYGLESAEWRASDLRLNQLGGTDFLVQQHDRLVGLVRLRIPGVHNVRNALGAIVVAAHLGIDFNVMRHALAEFGGVGRRFQLVGEVGDVSIVDDYAHHPTEIRATLAAARQRFPGRRIWAVWQPHTFTRTKKLLADFAASFDDADRVVALDIYRSRETDTLGLDTPTVLQAMKHANAKHAASNSDAASFILDRVRPGDVVVTLSAGDANKVGEAVLRGISERLATKTTANNREQSAVQLKNIVDSG